MKGSPLLRAGLVLLALLTLILPLRGLTNRRLPARVRPAPSAAPLASVHLAITATTFPFHFAISHLGKIIWAGESATGRSEKEVALPFPPEGIDLLVEANWEGEQETAVRLEVARAGQTLWGTRRVNDVLTFLPTP